MVTRRQDPPAPPQQPPKQGKPTEQPQQFQLQPNGDYSHGHPGVPPTKKEKAR